VIEASCHCGAVRFAIDDAPTEVTDCNCSICRRYGALWAYYAPSQVRPSHDEFATDIYLWGERSLEFHRCANCGCITHWLTVDRAGDRMGINARLMAPATLALARVRRLDGAATWQEFDD
jgi:hypothetical protein